MKSVISLLLLLPLITLAQVEDSFRLRLLGKWNNPNLSTNPNMDGQIWNELTGWVDTSNGKEYIIMGSIDSIYFFDVTDPTQIKLCDVEWGLNQAINRDVETYSHYVYTASDNAPKGKLQIFDLQYLPDSVQKVYESDEFGHNTHSLFINPESKRLYMCINRVDSSLIGMDILSIDTPDKPSFLGRLQTNQSTCGRVHEVYVKRDTAFCSCEYKGLYVYDLTDLSNQKLLGSITPPYPYNGYNHTNWTDSANQFIAFTDEVPQGQPIKIYRIRELNDMTYHTHFNTHPGATPHNLFWIGNLLYVSWYHDGVYIWDMSNPRTPSIYAYYDTYHQNKPGDYSGFKGCWGVYPFLPSGNIAASDMSNGLFMLKYDITAGNGNIPNSLNQLQAYPNPFENQLNILINLKQSMRVKFVLYSIHGNVIEEKELLLPEGESDNIVTEKKLLKSGMYVLSLVSETGETRHIKIMKY